MSKMDAQEYEANLEAFAIQASNPPKTTLEDLLEQYGTKSAVIRYLDSKGWSRGAIAKFMGIRYQHVRNVLTQELKRK